MPGAVSFVFYIFISSIERRKKLFDTSRFEPLFVPETPQIKTKQPIQLKTPFRGEAAFTFFGTRFCSGLRKDELRVSVFFLARAPQKPPFTANAVTGVWPETPRDPSDAVSIQKLLLSFVLYVKYVFFSGFHMVCGWTILFRDRISWDFDGLGLSGGTDPGLTLSPEQQKHLKGTF